MNYSFPKNSLAIIFSGEIDQISDDNSELPETAVCFVCLFSTGVLMTLNCFWLIWRPLPPPWASLVVQLVKNPPAMWETWVRSLLWEDPLEKGAATHSSILAWEMP